MVACRECPLGDPGRGGIRARWICRALVATVEEIRQRLGDNDCNRGARDYLGCRPKSHTMNCMVETIDTNIVKSTALRSTHKTCLNLRTHLQFRELKYRLGAIQFNFEPFHPHRVKWEGHLAKCPGVIMIGLRECRALCRPLLCGRAFTGSQGRGLQQKVLRAIEDAAVRRGNAPRARPVDVRYVASTSKDLGAEVDAGRFRRDLYFRLAGATFAIPPLRERRDEILPLAEQFIASASAPSAAHSPSPRTPSSG
jgi:hypothetical protein